MGGVPNTWLKASNFCLGAEAVYKTDVVVSCLHDLLGERALNHSRRFRGIREVVFTGLTFVLCGILCTS